MTLLEEIVGRNTVRRTSCSVGTLLKDLDPQDRADLTEAFNNPAIMSSAIARALRNRGHKLGDYTIRRHRDLKCSCHDAG